MGVLGSFSITINSNISISYNTKLYFLCVLHASFRPVEFCSSSDSATRVFSVRLPGWGSSLSLEPTVLRTESRSKRLSWTMKLYLKLLLQHGIHHIHSEYTGQWGRKVYATYTVPLQAIWQRWGYINFLQRWEWDILNNILTWPNAIMSVRLYYQIIILSCLLSRPPLCLESSAWAFTGILESLNREFTTKDLAQRDDHAPLQKEHMPSGCLLHSVGGSVCSFSMLGSLKVIAFLSLAQ